MCNAELSYITGPSTLTEKDLKDEVSVQSGHHVSQLPQPNIHSHHLLYVGRFACACLWSSG